MMTGFINGIKPIGNITGAIGDAVTASAIASPVCWELPGRPQHDRQPAGYPRSHRQHYRCHRRYSSKDSRLPALSPAKEVPAFYLTSVTFALGIEGGTRHFAAMPTVGGFAPRAEIARGAGYTGGISSAPVRHEHSGRIVIEGVNSKGEFIDAVEVVLSGLDSPQVKRRIDEALYETRRSRLAPQGAY